MRNMKKVKRSIILTAALAAILGLTACRGQEAGPGEESMQTEQNVGEDSTAEKPEGLEDAGGDGDQAAPDPAEDDWYTRGIVYKNDSGNSVEVFFDDYGMLEFAVDGISMYYSSVDRVQYENNWRLYECDGDIMIIYYEGEPARLEISGGDFAGMYEAEGEKDA